MTTERKNPFATYRTDASLEVNGVWIEEPNFRIKIARAGGKNARFKSVSERIFRPIRRALELGTISNELAAQKTAELLAEGVILDWQTRDLDGPEDLDDALWINGVPDPETYEIVPATSESITAALLAAPELTEYLMQQAKDSDIFREDFEGDAKN